MTESDFYPQDWPFFWMGGKKCGPFKHPPRPPHPPFPHGMPPWVIELFGFRNRRAERGEVRYLILDAIKDQPRHGYEIIQTIESKTQGGYRPSPGTIYPTLQMLEEMGHARSTDKDGRKVYEITEEGLAELKAHQEEVEEAYERLGQNAEWIDPEEFHTVIKKFRRLMRSIGRSFRRGHLGPSQIREIRKAIEEALEKVEKVVSQKKD